MTLRLTIAMALLAAVSSQPAAASQPRFDSSAFIAAWTRMTETDSAATLAKASRAGLRELAPVLGLDWHAACAALPLLLPEAALTVVRPGRPDKCVPPGRRFIPAALSRGP